MVKARRPGRKPDSAATLKEKIRAVGCKPTKKTRDALKKELAKCRRTGKKSTKKSTKKTSTKARSKVREGKECGTRVPKNVRGRSSLKCTQLRKALGKLAPKDAPKAELLRLYRNMMARKRYAAAKKAGKKPAKKKSTKKTAKKSKK